MPSPQIDLIPASQLTPEQRRKVIALCDAAFEEDFSALFELLPDSVHVLVWADRTLVAHACWMERWLQPAGLPVLHTAYVEAVAVVPGSQRQGWGTLAMRRIGEAIAVYQLGGLATGSPSFYTRLGWEQWRGPTAIRMADGLLPTPDEHPMILRTAHTPPLDLDALLTAEWRIGELW
jgi:aminoglycoside 2'-N-acetyltransferase I